LKGLKQGKRISKEEGRFRYSAAVAAAR